MLWETKRRVKHPFYSHGDWGLERGCMYICMDVLNAIRETTYCLHLLDGEIILSRVIREGFMEEVVTD